MKGKNIEINGIVYAPVKKATKKAKKVNKEDIKSKNLKKSKDWYAKKGIKIIREGFKAKLPTKNGIKEYDAVQFNNGKTGVILNCGFIKYAWK